jgi:hypothetical protein
VYRITEFGAMPNDAADDTPAILAALAACERNGGGVVVVPPGSFRVKRQGSESPILAIPSNTTFRGVGPASMLKFDPAVNESNFWRMLGAPAEGCRNVVIRDLHLNGSTTFKGYDKGKTPEQNHGIFLHAPDKVIENIRIADCLIENFAGDCIALSKGCRNIAIENIQTRNYVRQGIQMGGDENARDYRVTGCQDLAGTVTPGGSSIHVEHADGLRNVIIEGNHCHHSILASGVDGMVIRGNMVRGQILGNYNKNLIVSDNLVRADRKLRLVQFGYSQGLQIQGNMLIGDDPETGGVYVWGRSRYDETPSSNVFITGNQIRVETLAVHLNGVEQADLRGNFVRGNDSERSYLLQRTEAVRMDAAESPE